MKPEVFTYGKQNQNTLRFDYIISTFLDEGMTEDEPSQLQIRTINSNAVLMGDDIGRFTSQYNNWLKRGI